MEDEIFRLKNQERYDLIMRVEKKLEDEYNNTYFYQQKRLGLEFRKIIILFLVSLRRTLMFKIRFYK